MQNDKEIREIKTSLNCLSNHITQRWVIWVVQPSISYPSSKTTTKSDNVVRFIKIAEEIPNLGMYTNLGSSALYLIATLPEEGLPNVETLRHLETSELLENVKKPAQG